MSGVAAPNPGDVFDLDGVTIEVTVVNRLEETVCGVVPSTADSCGNCDRVHDIPWATVAGQEWACLDPDALRHFEELADALADALYESQPIPHIDGVKWVQWFKDVDAIATACAVADDRFDLERFVDACCRARH